LKVSESNRNIRPFAVESANSFHRIEVV
jgi:hypothetical protein